MKREGLLSDLG